MARWTEASTAEQSAAGLESPDLSWKLAAIDHLTKNKYRERQWPFRFIICVRHYTKRGIFAEISPPCRAAPTRIANSKEALAAD